MVIKPRMMFTKMVSASSDIVSYLLSRFVYQYHLVLEPGSQITRSYKGIVYTVEAVANGYLYKGKRYKSLSGIAKAITGKNWNGKVFFGVKNER